MSSAAIGSSLIHRRAMSFRSSQSRWTTTEGTGSIWAVPASRPACEGMLANDRPHLATGAQCLTKMQAMTALRAARVGLQPLGTARHGHFVPIGDKLPFAYS